MKDFFNDMSKMQRDMMDMQREMMQMSREMQEMGRVVRTAQFKNNVRNDRNSDFSNSDNYRCGRVKYMTGRLKYIKGRVLYIESQIKRYYESREIYFQELTCEINEFQTELDELVVEFKDTIKTWSRPELVNVKKAFFDELKYFYSAEWNQRWLKINESFSIIGNKALIREWEKFKNCLIDFPQKISLSIKTVKKTPASSHSEKVGGIKTCRDDNDKKPEKVSLLRLKKQQDSEKLTKTNEERRNKEKLSNEPKKVLSERTSQNDLAKKERESLVKENERIQKNVEKEQKRTDRINLKNEKDFSLLNSMQDKLVNVSVEKDDDEEFVYQENTVDKQKELKQIKNIKAKESPVTTGERPFIDKFFEILKDTNYRVTPQFPLRSILEKKDKNIFVDYDKCFGLIVDVAILDENWDVKLFIEIDDKTHFEQERKERDERLNKICAQVGIPLLRFYVSKGVNEWYIRRMFFECGLEV